MSANSIYRQQPTPSPCCVGYWRGMQDSTDGRTAILDSSGKGNHLVLGANATYANVVGTNAGYATIIGAGSPTDRSLATSFVLPWDMALGQSLLLAVTIKAAAPGATAHLFNARGASNDVKGMSLVMDNLGRPQVFVRDTVATSSTGAPTDVACDNTDKLVIAAIDGTSKRAYGYLGATPWSTTGTAGVSLSASAAGSTQCDDPARWGASGDFASGNGTWVSGANLLIKQAQLYVMPYWPNNMAAILAELVKNPHRPLPARMLPALVSA